MKTDIVTGASTGIGRAVAQALAAEGFEVVLVSRRLDKLQETEALIKTAGGQAHCVVADLASSTSVNQLIESIQKKFQQIDLIANIAGIWHGADAAYANRDFHTFDQSIINDTLQVGVFAPVLLVHGLLPMMSAGGKIINLSGTFENGAKGWLPYYVSKRALEDFTLGLSQELADQGITVNCISPSDTATEAYAHFFPEYIEVALEPQMIAEMFVTLSQPTNTTTGKVIVMKKGLEPFEDFHY